MISPARFTAYVALAMFSLSTTAFSQEITVIRAGTLFDSRSGDVEQNRLIFVQDERIAGVTDGDAPIPEGARVIDLSNSFVLPGVMDMHTHIVGNLSNNYFSGYFQSPHRATIGGVVNAHITLMAGSQPFAMLVLEIMQMSLFVTLLMPVRYRARVLRFPGRVSASLVAIVTAMP